MASAGLRALMSHRGDMGNSVSVALRSGAGAQGLAHATALELRSVSDSRLAVMRPMPAVTRWMGSAL